ncbi:ATP-dependent RNA helicase DDX27, partial [Tremellales sp. Uapishka_1]
MPNDLITTLDSDDEGSNYGESSRTSRPLPKVDELDPEFEFDMDGGVQETDTWGGDELLESSAANTALSVDDIIARRSGHPLKAYRQRKRKLSVSASEGSSDGDSAEDNEVGQADSSEEEDGFGAGVEGPDDDSDQEMMNGEGEEDDGEEEDVEDASSGEDGSLDSETEDTPAEAARKDAFFAQDPTIDPSLPTSFASMNLSRPLLRALTALSLNHPTPIQARAIPLALLGRDILGSAVTGSGKTAAFMVPVLERLCYRDRGKGGQACRVLVLCPTRELAVQCEAVGRALAEKGGLDVRFALLVGGLSLSAQAHTLRTLPDILIATPGRLIDHLNNTPSFTLSALDVLVIDEADRMLEAGFNDELEEIIKSCPRSRQTMLFSATMTDSVDELVKLSLDRPVRVFVDPKRNTAAGLTQEFVRIRTDDTRSPSLLALCKRTVREKCIIFFRSKALAHQMRVVFGLCGLKAAELHGNLTQEQQVRSTTFSLQISRREVSMSRVWKLSSITTCLDNSRSTPIGSVERHELDARDGMSTLQDSANASSITLVGEADRKLLKAAIKQSEATQIRHRIIPAEAVSDMTTRLEGLKEDVQEVLEEEREEKLIRQADMEIKKGQNMVEHESEIFGRPARTWFQSEKEKKAAKDAGKTAYVSSFPTTTAPEKKADKVKHGKYDGLSRKAKRRKMALEDDEDSGAVSAAIRSAKRGARPGKISEPLARPTANKKKSSKGKKRGSAFDDVKGKTKSKHEGMRAGRDSVGMTKKGKKGGKGGKGK